MAVLPDESGQGGEIGPTPVGVGVVDPDQGLQAGSRAERGHHGGARLGLVGRGNGVLEVDDHQVGATGGSLGVPVGTISRHEQRRDRVRDLGIAVYRRSSIAFDARQT